MITFNFWVLGTIEFISLWGRLDEGNLRGTQVRAFGKDLKRRLAETSKQLFGRATSGGSSFL